jgi:hypothetical protein
MNPSELRDSVTTIFIFTRLVDYWSESSRCSRKDALQDLQGNSEGDYKVFQEYGSWFFTNANSGERALYNHATATWEFVDFNG